MEEPLQSEHGRSIDAIFSGTSISNRIVTSPMLVGITEQVLEDIENEIVKMYFD